MLAALLIPFPSLSPSGRKLALFYELENLCHPLAFALLSLVLARTARVLRGGTLRSDLLWIGALLVAFGAATELLQAFTGRDASMIDFVGDCLGSGTGLGLHWKRHADPGQLAAPRWIGKAVALAAVLSLLPLLWTLAAYAARHARFPQIWQSESVLLHRFSRHQEGNYPGLDIREPYPDWRGFREMLITVRNPGPSPATFVVRVNDSRHTYRYDDRFNQELEIAAGETRSYAIPMEKILKSPATRDMDLSQVTSVMVFQLRERSEPRVDVVEIRLAR